MQYVLTDEEFKALAPRSDLEARDAALEAARVALLAVAGHKCIHDRERDTHGRRAHGGYCDLCPVVTQTGDDFRGAHRLICTRPKNFSK